MLQSGMMICHQEHNTSVNINNLTVNSILIECDSVWWKMFQDKQDERYAGFILEVTTQILIHIRAQHTEYLNKRNNKLILKRLGVYLFGYVNSVSNFISVELRSV